jgi:hypothetical protein
MGDARRQMSKDSNEFGVDVAFRIWATKVWSNIVIVGIAVVFLAVTVFA